MSEPATVPCVDFNAASYGYRIISQSEARCLGLSEGILTLHVILPVRSFDGEAGRIRTATRELRESLNELLVRFMPTSGQRAKLRIRTAEFADEYYRLPFGKSVNGSGIVYLVVPDYCIGKFYDDMSKMFTGFFQGASD